MSMGAAVRLVAVVLEIREEKRPKPVSTSIDQRPRKVFSEYAITLIANLRDFVVKSLQLDRPP